MLRKRPLVSRWCYLGCPLRYLKTVLILPWIYCILDKADGLHHHGWIHFPGGCARGENVCGFLFVLFCVCVFLSFHNRWMLNTLRPRKNAWWSFRRRYFRFVLLNENIWISIKISLKFLPKGPINNIPALVPIMTWRRPGDKPLSKPMMVSLLTHICATRRQWVKYINYHFFLHCTIYSLPVHMYRWCICIHFYRSIHIFVYYIAILPLVTNTPQNTTYWTLSCLAIYSNLKLLINFLFYIIQKRAIKFWGEHFSIRTITPSRHGNVTKAIIKHFRLILNLYIKFAKGKIIWYPGRC